MKLKGGVLTGISKGFDTCTITATRFDEEGRVADELELTIHIPPDLIAAHVTVMTMGNDYEKDAVKDAFYAALERLFGKSATQKPNEEKGST